MRVWLKNIRAKREITQFQLANKVDVTQQAIQLYERGERRPRPEVAKRIALELGFNWTRFFEENTKELEEQ